MADFYFSDKSYSFGPWSREVRIKVNNILLLLCKDGNIWNCYFYDLRKQDGEQYIIDISISNDTAAKIIKEAQEYQEYLYESNSY